MTKEVVLEKKLSGIIEELEEYLNKLSNEATLCRNEAERSLARFSECGEMKFYINHEELEIEKFLRTLHKILCFKIPSIGLSRMFSMPSSRVTTLVEHIEILRDYLISIPGARFYNYSEIPEVMKKLRVEKIVRITA